MNVHRINSGARAAAGHVAAQEADDASRSRPAQAPASADASGHGDRFEFSEAARAQQVEAASRKAEVATARAALRELSELNPAQADAIRQRIHEGYYDRAEVMEVVASKLASALAREASGTEGA